MKPNHGSDRVLLIHILERIDRIRTYTAEGRAAFFDSRLVQDAVYQNLQTLAQSTQRLSIALKSSEPGIPWDEIARFRETLVHNYLELDRGLIWRFVENDLQALRSAIERMFRMLASTAASPSDAVERGGGGARAE